MGMRVGARRGKGVGFTLVELLVVIAIVAVLVTVAMVGASRAIAAGKQAACISNLRSIGIGMRLYADDHHGVLPGTTHLGDFESSWIYTLEAYMGDFDEARICPADPKGKERLAQRGTSYVLNSFLFVPRTDPFGDPIGPALNRLTQIPDPARTAMAFICSDTTPTGPGEDHTHSSEWSSWAAVTDDISPGRFGGGDKDETKGSTNILYVDGGVLSKKAGELKRLIDSGVNFAMPPGVEGL